MIFILILSLRVMRFMDLVVIYQKVIIVEAHIALSNSLRMYSNSLMNMGIVFKKESLVSILAEIMETGENVVVVYHGELAKIRNNL